MIQLADQRSSPRRHLVALLTVDRRVVNIALLNNCQMLFVLLPIDIHHQPYLK
jgi:hypothetical protein